MKPKTLFLLLFSVAAFFHSFCSGFQNRSVMENKNLSVTLQMHSGTGKLECVLTFTNTTKSVQYLYKVNSCYGNEILNDVFEISSKGKPIPYSEPRAKLPAPTPKDFEELLPGKSVQRNVRLDKSYDFAKERKEYEIRYRAFHGSPKDASQLNELISDKIIFFYQAE